MAEKQEDSEDARGGLAPGDEAPPEEPSAGENICSACDGSGRLEGGECPNCGGRGMVVEAVGGG